MTKFVFISGYDNSGYPTNINVGRNDENIKAEIPQGLIDEVHACLPNGTTVVDLAPEWIKKSDLQTKEPCEFSITFLSEGAGHRNALGYYVYDISNPVDKFGDIDEIFIVFPNASLNGSGGSMSSGDSMVIPYSATTKKVNGITYVDVPNYTFPAGKGIGLVCLANAWQNNRVITQSAKYSSDPNINPERTSKLRHHFVNYRSEVDNTKIIYGIEDLRRDHWSDNDFNDMVFMVEPTPIDALDDKSYNYKDVIRYGNILCEDILEGGDFDYNDLNAKYNIVSKVHGNKVYSMTLKFDYIYRGSSYDHNFGIIVDGIKDVSTCKIYRETYGADPNYPILECLTNDVIGNTNKVQLITGSKSHLTGGFYNTTGTLKEPVHVQVKILFPGGVDKKDIDTHEFRYYLDVYHGNNMAYILYSDKLYAAQPKVLAAGITSQKRILVLEQCQDIIPAKEKAHLVKAYPLLLKHWKAKNRHHTWYTPKNSKSEFLAEPVVYTDTHVYNNTISADWDDSNYLLHPTSLQSFDLNSTSALSDNNMDSSNILNWQDINTSNVDEIYSLIVKYGPCYIKNSDVSNPTWFCLNISYEPLTNMWIDSATNTFTVYLTNVDTVLPYVICTI
jgi:hypothetical protein